MALTTSELNALDRLYDRFLWAPGATEEELITREGLWKEYCSAQAVFEWRKREAKRKEKAA